MGGTAVIAQRQPQAAGAFVKPGRAVAFGPHGGGPDEYHVGPGTQSCEQGLVGRSAQGPGVSVEGAGCVETGDHVQAY